MKSNTTNTSKTPKRLYIILDESGDTLGTYSQLKVAKSDLITGERVVTYAVVERTPAKKRASKTKISGATITRDSLPKTFREASAN